MTDTSKETEKRGDKPCIVSLLNVFLAD